MFGDAHSKGAFSRPQLVILAVFIAAGSITVGLYALGLPVEYSGGVFAGLFIGLLLLAKPLFKRTEPTFGYMDAEN